MSSPTTIRARYPRTKPKQADIGEFLPYATNLVNAFRKVPQPMAPSYIDPVRTGRVSMAGTRNQINEATHVADLGTEGLDAQTGAAIRVGNLGQRIRGLSMVNQEEANTNTQYANQANQINAGINAQNVGIHNAYQDDVVQARIAGQREQSENFANFSDKVTANIARKDQIKLEGDKAKVLSRMYDRGLYSRYTDYLKDKGVDVPGEDEGTRSDYLKKLSKTLVGPRKFAAGGMMKVFGTGDPVPKPAGAVGSGAKVNFDIDSRMDAVNYSIGRGVNPATHERGKVLMSNYTDGVELSNAVNVFNSRSDIKSLSPEERVKTFYSMTGGSPVIQQFRDKYRNYGYGANVAFRSIPDEGVRTMVARKAYGGSMSRVKFTC